MKLLTLNQIKHQLNIELENTEDDNYLTDLESVAYYSIENILNYSISTKYIDNNIEVPSPIKHAILLLISNLYANREPVAYGNPYIVPFSIAFLIQPYINYNPI